MRTIPTLHRDIIDSDNFIQVLSGCKEVVVLWEDAAMVGGDVLGSRIPGTNAFSFNPFDAPSELTGAPELHGMAGTVSIAQAT